MIGMKKDVPEIVTKWEKEKKISSYRWVDHYTDGTDAEGNPIKVKTGTERAYGVTEAGTLEIIPQHIKDYFKKAKAEKQAEKAKSEKK